MKKILLTTILALGLAGLAACNSKTTTKKETTVAPTTTNKSTSSQATSNTTTVAPKETVEVLVPSGTPLMAIGNLIGTEGLEVTNVSGPEVLTTELAKNQVDMIIAPLTAGAKLSIAGKSKYKLEAVLTTNNTYLIGKDSSTLTNITDVKNKKIIAYGRNNTPDIALKNALKNNSISAEDDVTITYENDVNTATSTFFASDDYDYCLIAEPQITQLKVGKGLELKVLDLSAYMSTTIYQAGIFVNPNANQTRVNEVVEDIKNNITYLNANPAEYASKVVDKAQFFTKMGETVLAQSIPNANISFIKAKDNKDSIIAYYTEVNNFNSSILGGMVTDEFFR